MLGCYILCSEILFGVDQVEEVDSKSKVEVVRLGKIEFEDIDKNSKVEVVHPGKFKFEDIDNKSKRSTDKRSTGRCMEID
jgi:hypothetical protein